MTRTRDQNFRRSVSNAPPDTVYTLRLKDFCFFPLFSYRRPPLFFLKSTFCLLLCIPQRDRTSSCLAVGSLLQTFTFARVFALQLLNFLIRKH